MATVDELLQEARMLGQSREDVIVSLSRVIEQNEKYRKRRQGKKTKYDLLLAETQPALALVLVMLQEQMEESNDVVEGQ